MTNSRKRKTTQRKPLRRTPGEGSGGQHPDGRHRWRRRITLPDGTGKEVTEYSHISLADAREKCHAKVAVLLGTGGVEVDLKPLLEVFGSGIPGPSCTVREWIDWWIPVLLRRRVDIGKISKGTWINYEAKARLYILPTLGPLPLKTLTPLVVTAWLMRLEAEGFSARVVRDARSVLRIAIQAAMGLEVWPVGRTNPVGPTDAPTITRFPKGGHTLEQARRLLRTIDGDHTRWAALYRLGMMSPTRPGELLGAEWDVLDLDAEQFEIKRNLVYDDEEREWRQHDTKGHLRSQRTIPLLPEVAAALRHHRATQAAERLREGPRWQPETVFDVELKQHRASDLVFTSPKRPGGAVWLESINWDLTRLCRLAGVPRITPNQMRHVTNTLLFELKVPEEVRMYLCGHRNKETQHMYVDRYAERARQAVDLLGEKLSG